MKSISIFILIIRNSFNLITRQFSLYVKVSISFLFFFLFFLSAVKIGKLLPGLNFGEREKKNNNSQLKLQMMFYECIFSSVTISNQSYITPGM